MFREFSLDASVEMPNRISSLGCSTHRLKIKVSGASWSRSQVPLRPRCCSDPSEDRL